jgi:ribose transport system substrate-binding protein
MTPIRMHLALGLVALACASLTAPAHADDFLDAAKKKIATATMTKEVWDGPTSGPKAVAAKTLVFVAADMKNGGIVGVSKGVEEAGKAIGWNVRVIDGQGSVSGRTAALNQALALKPAGIVVGGFDTTVTSPARTTRPDCSPTSPP